MTTEQWKKHVAAARTGFALAHVGRPVDGVMVEREIKAMLRIVIFGRLMILATPVFVTAEYIEQRIAEIGR